MGCCCGLFKSKKSKKSKHSQVQTQGFAPRPVQLVVENGKVSSRPTKDSYQQQAPPVSAQQQQYDPQYDAVYQAKLARNQMVAGKVAGVAVKQFGAKGQMVAPLANQGAAKIATMATDKMHKRE